MATASHRPTPHPSARRHRVVVAAVAVIVAAGAGGAAPGVAAVRPAAPAPAAEAAGPLAWVPPLGRPLEVTRPFEPPPTPYAAGHRGIDLRAAAGDAVSAPAAGTVSFSGAVAGRGVVSIRLDARTVVSLEPVAGAPPTGAEVAAGAPLGELRAGGHCGGDCLHLGVRVDDAYVDPMRFFAERPVLLPW